MTNHKRRPFLDPQTLDHAVQQIADIAQKQGVRIALIGGYAMQLYGSPRLTGDVDVAAENFVEHLAPGPTLRFGGIQTKAPNNVPVDLVVRGDDYKQLYLDAISTAQRIAKVPLPVVTPEYLAAMKMVAGRNGKDDADLEFLIVSNAVDPQKAHQVIRKHLGPYAADEFDRIVEVAIWKHSKQNTPK